MFNSMSFSRTDPNQKDEIISDENNDEFEHTLIDDIDNNGYLIEEEVIDVTHIYNGYLRYTILGRPFSTSDDAYDFYNEYGLSKGFGIQKHQLNRYKDTNEVYRRIFSCNKEGEWVVDQFSDEHNHPFDSSSKVIKQRSYSIFHRSNECKDVVTLLSKAGMKPSEITKIVNAFRGDTYKQWAKSQYVEEFELGWEKLKEKYHIEDDSWLGNMFKLRHHWVKAYLQDTFFAGMTTSGRSESIHSFFDGFVNSKTMLNEFVVQYDKAVSSRRSVENDQDFRTLNSKPTLYSNHSIEEMAATCYTRNNYDIFKKEWKASFDCGHEILSTDGVKVIYRVGFLKVKTKGHQKCAIRVKPGLEVSLDLKKKFL
ncbi:protein FAR1-related sequence 5 [Tanacetum coccineum]